MIVQSSSASFFDTKIARSSLPRQNPASPAANRVDTVRISQAAREALASSNAASSAATNSDKSVEERLAAIKAKGGPMRTLEEQEYVFANDRRLTEIYAQDKPVGLRTADEIEYVQKAVGFVPTFAYLSSGEKALYDKAVGSGNTEAARGISLIALFRHEMHTAGGANGKAYDLLNAEITVGNIEKYYSNSFVDPSGRTQSGLQALIRFLQDNPVT